MNYNYKYFSNLSNVQFFIVGRKDFVFLLLLLPSDAKVHDVAPATAAAAATIPIFSLQFSFICGKERENCKRSSDLRSGLLLSVTTLAQAILSSLPKHRPTNIKHPAWQKLDYRPTTTANFTTWFNSISRFMFFALLNPNSCRQQSKWPLPVCLFAYHFKASVLTWGWRQLINQLSLFFLIIYLLAAKPWKKKNRHIKKG